MTRDPAWVTTLKNLANDPRTIADILERTTVYEHGESRTVALLAATDVEDALLSLLRNKMRQNLSKDDDNRLFGSTSPLGTHGTRIHLCYALGFYGKRTRFELDIIRLIRNAFAHSRKLINFDTKEIAAACEKLSIVNNAAEIYHSASIPFGEFKSAKSRYIQTCRVLEIELTRDKNRNVFMSAFPAVPLD